MYSGASRGPAAPQPHTYTRSNKNLPHKHTQRRTKQHAIWHTACTTLKLGRLLHAYSRQQHAAATVAHPHMASSWDQCHTHMKCTPRRHECNHHPPTHTHNAHTGAPARAPAQACAGASVPRRATHPTGTAACTATRRGTRPPVSACFALPWRRCGEPSHGCGRGMYKHPRPPQRAPTRPGT